MSGAAPKRSPHNLRRSFRSYTLIGTSTLALTGVLMASAAAVAAPSNQSVLSTSAPSASPTDGAGSEAATTATAQRASHARCLRQFEGAVHKYLDTTHRRDVKGYKRLLAPGHTIVLPGGTVFAGRGPAEAFVEKFFARTDWTQTFQQTSQSVDSCRTGLVVFDSVYTDGDGPVPLVIALTWTYQRGHWLLLTDQNTVKDI